MTIVEIYDSEPVNNVVASLALKPDKLVFLCNKQKKPSDKEISNLRAFFSSALKGLEISFQEFSHLDFTGIIKIFEEISANNNDVIFELTGGYEPAIMAASNFCLERNIPCFYLDYNEKNPLVALTPLPFSEISMPRLTIDQILLLNGCQKRHHGHIQMDINNREQASDLLKIVDIALNDKYAWRNLIRYFQFVSKDTREEMNFHSRYKIKASKNNEIFIHPKIMDSLDKKGLISINKKLSTSDIVHFRFKNEMVKGLLKSDGFWLEFYTYYMAGRINYFDEIAMSSIIDWNYDSKNLRDPINEIDLILVRGITPIFISCKTSVPSAFDLYEIKSLAEKFGGSMAKAVLVTSSDLNSNKSYFVRARELNIRIIEKSSLSEGIFSYVLKQL